MAKTTTSTKSKKVTKTESSVESATPVEVTLAPVTPVVTLTQTELPTPPQTLVSVVSEEAKSSQVVSDSVIDESSTELLFNKLLNQFQDVQSVMKTLHSNLKVLQKEVQRERKESKKREYKKKKGGKKTPSGFATASVITPVLANFLGLGSSDTIARTEVTSKVISYVKEQNLQNPANKKQIIPDAKLELVLEAGSDVVTFFNLQTYLKKHFLGKSVTTETQEQSATVV